MTLRNSILHAFLGLGLLGTACSAALSQNLGEWRTLTAKEERARLGETPISEADPSTIEADFDGDGRKDRALIAVRRSDGARGLVVAMKGRVRVIEPEGVEPQDGLRLAEPGSWDTICGNAFREFHQEPCDEGYPARVDLRNPGILRISNGATILYFWDRTTGRFDSVLMVD